MFKLSRNDFFVKNLKVTWIPESLTFLFQAFENFLSKFFEYIFCIGFFFFSFILFYEPPKMEGREASFITFFILSVSAFSPILCPRERENEKRKRLS